MLFGSISCVYETQGRFWLLLVSTILLVVLLVIESVSLWKTHDIESRIESLFKVDVEKEMENLIPHETAGSLSVTTEYNQSTTDYLLDQMSRYYRFIFRENKEYEVRTGSKILEKIFTENNTQLSCLLLEEPDALVILFKGTTTPYEWREDFKYSSVPVPNSWTTTPVKDIQLHKGFVEFYSIMRDDIQKYVKKYTNIYICGHSLGAALAQLCSFDCKLQNLATYCLTIGSPRVGNPAFAEYMGDTSLFQLRNDADVIMNLPTTWIVPINGKHEIYSYVHAGTMYMFNEIASNLGTAHMLSVYKKHTNKDHLCEVRYI